MLLNGFLLVNSLQWRHMAVILSQIPGISTACSVRLTTNKTKKVGLLWVTCGYPLQRASCVENVLCHYVIIFDSIDKNYNYCKIYLWVPSHLLVGRGRIGTNLFFTVRKRPIFTSVMGIVLEIRLRRKNTTFQRSNVMRCGYSCIWQ